MEWGLNCALYSLADDIIISWAEAFWNVGV